MIEVDGRQLTLTRHAIARYAQRRHSSPRCDAWAEEGIRFALRRRVHVPIRVASRWFLRQTEGKIRADRKSGTRYYVAWPVAIIVADRTVVTTIDVSGVEDLALLFVHALFGAWVDE